MHSHVPPTARLVPEMPILGSVVPVIIHYVYVPASSLLSSMIGEENPPEQG